MTRSVGNAKQVFIRSLRLGMDRVQNTQWCKRLGEEWFGLREKRGNGDVTYRQLVSYFARRKRDGGIDNPTRTFRNQSTASSETSLAYLFGLDAELVRRLHQAKAALKQTKDAQTALAALDLAAAEGSKRADLEAQLEAQIASVKLGHDRLLERINAFNVLPAFRELERELATLNEDFRALSDGDVIDQEAIDVNVGALEAEALTDAPDLARLFEEAKIVFPELVLDRYEEVQRFHEQLVTNRKFHLQTEIAAARRRITMRGPLREQVEARRRDITRSLRASGPADELLQLRDELAGREAALRQLEGRLQEARKLEERAEELKREVEEAVRALRQDRRERSTITTDNDNAASGTTEHDVQRLMLALTRLLTGARGDPHGAAFNAALMVVVGAPLATDGLLWFADLARFNRRHAVHFSLEHECPIPRIAFAFRQGDTVTVHEECFLAVRPGSDRVAIVPDSFADGAFQLGSDMKLKRHKAPASFQTAMPLMQQPYACFAALLDSAVPTAAWRPIRVSAH